MQTNELRVLAIGASARSAASASRELSNNLIDALDDRFGGVRRVRRDLSTGMPFVDETWIGANFTPEESRSKQHHATLAFSDTLVAELEEADVLVIGVPMYNFNIPASLKAWIDMVARARRTFRYTENGPKGLLENKKAYLLVTTGGVPVGSPMDFATPYLKHALGFLGITDIDIIAADKLNNQADESMDAARARIAELVHLSPRAA
ncbi:MAG: FMN-dependent NADH-azoreductase [Woeseiaceae bacterium]